MNKDLHRDIRLFPYLFNILQMKLPSKDYPGKLRRIKFYDQDQKRHLVFLTNHFKLPALLVAELYRYRWNVELFFKWIKQHLRIKAFYGTTSNAVKTQVWIAVSVFNLGIKSYESSGH